MTDSNRAFRQRFPHCQVHNTENRMGPAEVLEQFGKPWEHLCATLTPVLIHWSADATDAQSTGLYVLLPTRSTSFSRCTVRPVPGTRSKGAGRPSP